MTPHATKKPVSFTAQTVRKAPWLLSPYDADIWTITDTKDATRLATIDFNFPLADGSSLTRHAALLHSVKEAAYWFRDTRLTSLDDAECHAALIRCLFYIVHGMTSMRIWDLDYLTPWAVSELIDRINKGTVSLIDADAGAQRITKLFADLAATQATNFDAYLEAVAPLHTRGGMLSVKAILNVCGVPPGPMPQAIFEALRAGAAIIGRTLRTTRKAGKSPSGEQVPAGTLLSYYRAMDMLWLMRPFADSSCLQFSPFDVTPTAAAAAVGIASKATELPPPAFIFQLLLGAFRWVTEEAPFILDTLAQRPARDFASNVVYERDHQLKFTVAVHYLAAACFILIAAFTARRRGEVLELLSDCLTGSDEDGWWCRCYINKTLQADSTIPVPHCLARAVEILKVLSAVPGEEPDGPRPLFHLFWEGKSQKFSPYRIDRFAQYIGVPSYRSDSGEELTWHWFPRQFRAIFAVLYFHRFRGAFIEAISHMLRHFSLENTRSYVRMDSETAALWDAVEWGYRKDIARSIAAGGPGMAGTMADRLKVDADQIRQKLAKTLRVVTEDDLASELEIAMAVKGLVLTPKPWVTCTCPRTEQAARIAACRSQRGPTGEFEPNYANAGPAVCASCSWALTMDEHKAFLDSEIESLKTATQSRAGEDTLLVKLAQARLFTLSPPTAGADSDPAKSVS